MAELQHYVPRFILRNFARGKAPQIYVYDKATDKRFRSNIRGVASETGFYDLDVKGLTVSLEPSFSRLETATASAVRKIVTNRNLAILTLEDYHVLATFLAVQFVRTKERRLTMQHLGEMLKDHLRRTGVSEDEIVRFTSDPDPGFDAEKASALNLTRHVQSFFPHFLYKGWILYETSLKDPFYISDNPVVMHNHVDHKPYGNLGLAVPGIQIYFPLSSTLCLSLMCPTLAAEFSKGYKSFQNMDRVAPGAAETRLKNAAMTRAMCEGVVTGSAVRLTEENVMHANSLQVVFSSRFVYCELDSFALVSQMIRDNPANRSALRPTAA